MPSTKRILFDSYAILKWTQKEPGYQVIKDSMTACRDKSMIGYMSEINLGEVYYKSIRAIGSERTKAVFENFVRLPIDFILPDRELILKAAEIKAEFAISYADCFAAATALRYGATILTGDPEFRKLSNLVKTEWI
jgi:predicted nucleic acid-binding protein